MSLRDIFNRVYPAAPHSAVIDTSDDTLIAIGTHQAALRFVNESMMDTLLVPDIVSRDVLSIKTSGPRSFPEWSWSHSTWKFKKTNPLIITEQMRERAILAEKKVEVISYFMYSINRLRGKLDTGFSFQMMIYTEKERQAQSLREANFDERLAPKIPYVVQYAENSGVSLQQAAEEILFQAQLDHEYLAKTEKVRLALFKKIKLAKTSLELNEIYSTFRKTGIA